MASGARREEVKVVLIDTQYVVTDPGSFKSVVQRLTGKASCVAWIEESRFTGATATPSPQNPAAVGNNSGGGGRGNSSRRLNAGKRGVTEAVSFGNLDKMISEMPMEEWNDLCGNIRT